MVVRVTAITLCPPSRSHAREGGRQRRLNRVERQAWSAQRVGMQYQRNVQSYSDFGSSQQALLESTLSPRPKAARRVRQRARLGWRRCETSDGAWLCLGLFPGSRTRRRFPQGASGISPLRLPSPPSTTVIGRRGSLDKCVTTETSTPAETASRVSRERKGRQSCRLFHVAS